MRDALIGSLSAMFALMVAFTAAGNGRVGPGFGSVPSAARWLGKKCWSRKKVCRSGFLGSCHHEAVHEIVAGQERAASENARLWHGPANPQCPLSRRVLEGKRTCHGDRESDVHDPEAGMDRRLAGCRFCRPTLFRHRPHRSAAIWYACISRSAVGSPRSGRRFMPLAEGSTSPGAPPALPAL